MVCAEIVMFDPTRPITMNLRTPEGAKTIRVRFPSDEDWIERHSQVASAAGWIVSG